MDTIQKAPVVGIITPRRGTPVRATVASITGFPRPPLRAVGRPDKMTALRIDAGLARSAECSRLEAFSKLVSEGIPVQTASRVVWSLRRD